MSNLKKAAEIGAVVANGIIFTLQVIGMFTGKDKAPQP